MVTDIEHDRGRPATPAARDAFLTSGTVGTGVREVIEQSWRRSAGHGVDPSGLTPAFHESPADPRLLACVDTVVGQLLKTMGAEPISIIFAAPTGQVLRRFCSDAALATHLERVSLVPGFDYAEGAVGTNGIGTAIQRDEATLIVGPEHFCEELTVFGCAGAPVRHPVSRALVGVVDLTCAADRANSLLLTYAQTIAERIEMELLGQVGAKELALLRDYLVACRHATGPIVALNADLVMMNHHAQQALTSSDRAALLARTSDASGVVRPTTYVADLPSGSVARMDYRPTFWGPDLAGGIFRIAVQAGRSGSAKVASKPNRLPGLAGTSPAWRRTAGQLRDSMVNHQWVVIDGENGVGKYALARATHYAESPERHFRMVDAAVAGADPDAWLAGVAEDLDGAPGTLVIRHLNLLPDDLVGPLSGLLVEQAASSRLMDGHWVVATRDIEAGNLEVEGRLVPIFDATITLDALRHRSEDVRAIAPLMLRQLAPTSDLHITARALNQMQRHPWPGNLHQLLDVLRKVVRTKRRGEVELADLPPEIMAVGRRRLSPLESLERDAIATALRHHGGNKSTAAEHLGMSRATIYRKIREYGITTDL